MPLKKINLKFIKTPLYLVLAGCLTTTINAQEVIEDLPNTEKNPESISSNKPKKIDGVAAVVGDYIILDSDIDKTYLQLKAQGANPDNFTRCELFGKLLEDKLYAHQAIQDSVVVNDSEIRANVDMQIQQFLTQTNGSMKELLEFYKKDDERSFRDEMFEINKNNKLSSEMQRTIINEVEVTPEEVRQFFNKIPKEERPTFGTELKVAQIIVEPKIAEDEEQRVIEQLKQYKKEVENGASFRSKVVLYTDDKGSVKTGGLYTLHRDRPQMVKEFREVAFSLQKGEISEPFKTDFGYHIVFLEKVRGQEYDVRHILLMPKVSDEAIKEAKEQLDTIKKQIEEGNITFAEAAKESSDDKATKSQGGQLINPVTQDYNFELTKMDPELYGQIQSLKNNEVSNVLTDQDRKGNAKFKILTVADRIDEHEADYARDYLKIKELALNEKRIKVISEWQNKKIMDTYIKISKGHRTCDFSSNWLKK